MTARNEVRFPVDDGVEFGAWLYFPKSDAQRCPAITMAHGYAGVKEHGMAVGEPRIEPMHKDVRINEGGHGDRGRLGSIRDSALTPHEGACSSSAVWLSPGRSGEDARQMPRGDKP